MSGLTLNISLKHGLPHVLHETCRGFASTGCGPLFSGPDKRQKVTKRHIRWQSDIMTYKVTKWLDYRDSVSSNTVAQRKHATNCFVCYSQIFLSWHLGRSCNTAKSVCNYTQIIHQWRFLLPNEKNLPKYNFRNTNSWHVAQECHVTCLTLHPQVST